MMNQFNDIDSRKINFSNINIGLIVILIGLLKKIVLSDNLSIYVNEGFTNSDGLTFINGWLTSLCFTFQFYFDFSGYVDMATELRCYLILNCLKILIAHLRQTIL